MCDPVGVGQRLRNSVSNDIPKVFVVRAVVMVFACHLMKPLDLGYKRG